MPDLPPEVVEIGKIETSIRLLFRAVNEFQEQDHPLKLTKEGFLKAFNNRITNAIYSIVSIEPALVEEFLIFLVNEGILKHFDQNIENNMGSSIAISTSKPKDGNYHDVGLLDIFVVSNNDSSVITFSRTNLNESKKLPPSNGHVLPYTVRLDVTDGTVDTSSLYNTERMAKLIVESMDKGLTVTFSALNIFNEIDFEG